MDDQDAGFREIPHTADAELHIWAPEMSMLLEQSARGMYALARITLAGEPRVMRVFEIPYMDRESLVVDLLSELLFYGEDEGLGFDTFRFSMKPDLCQVQVEGAPMIEVGKEIKAVTYHGMAVKENESGLEVNIVFDI